MVNLGIKNCGECPLRMGLYMCAGDKEQDGHISDHASRPEWCPLPVTLHVEGKRPKRETSARKQTEPKKEGRLARVGRAFGRKGK